MFHVEDEVGLEKGPPPAFARWAIPTFAVLFVMNLLDYMDRNILNAVLPQVRPSLRINNAQAGLLATYFLISYSLISPVMGWAGDRFRRTWLLAWASAVWSLATVGSGLARELRPLSWPAASSASARRPTASSRRRSWSTSSPRAAGAGPLGVLPGHADRQRLGMALGGCGQSRPRRWDLADWRGVLPRRGAGPDRGLAALFLPEPVRGASEGVDPERLRAHEQAGATRADYLDLMVNSSYTYAVFGMAAYTFAIGGMLVWFPTSWSGPGGSSRTGPTRSWAWSTAWPRRSSA